MAVNFLELLREHKETALFVGLSAVTFGLGVYSEYFLQANVANYYLLKNVIGQGLADFALTNMGDMMMPVAATLGMGLLMSATDRRTDPDSTNYKKTGLILTIGTGVSISLISTAIELLNMHGGGGAVDCANPYRGGCRGDWGDVLSSSVPMFSAALYLLKNKNHRPE